MGSITPPADAGRAPGGTRRRPTGGSDRGTVLWISSHVLPPVGHATQCDCGTMRRHHCFCGSLRPMNSAKSLALKDRLGPRQEPRAPASTCPGLSRGNEAHGRPHFAPAALVEATSRPLVTMSATMPLPEPVQSRRCVVCHCWRHLRARIRHCRKAGTPNGGLVVMTDSFLVTHRMGGARQAHQGGPKAIEGLEWVWGSCS
jgi:hypothetical protein